MRLCNHNSSTTFQPQAHHTVGSPLPMRPLRGGVRAASDRPHRGLAEKSEDNLTSPTQLTTEGDLRSGESPFRAGGCEEWGSALHRAGPEDARWEGRCSSPGEMTIDGTRGCAVHGDVHDSLGHRLSHHSHILLQQVDGSATVRENGCLSTTTSSTGNGSLATTIPSVRGRGATCAKVWNAIRRGRSDCIFLKGDK